ncbi:hypothetical protein [Chryseobacterium wangxinyae]|uniref:hypothetical protein n=1 Tax=Chryseobacterium sp. CY353 TaxID=2997334 RepID=UPI00226E174D|nr:hypothetical protein [Chryseobacterium sp. CY353]MCY0969568.1 hypothetical protein [Chryseobacterium sp. CY353]
MKKSILRLIAFSVLPFLFVSYSIYVTGQHTEDFYKRFTSPQQNSLILGSSRAASINPQLIDSIIHKKFPEVKLYNYAFTWAHSPYGPKYLESIKKKIRNNVKNGFFIVTVEPTALMVDKYLPDDPEYYVENDKSLAKTSSVASNPNIEYLLESYDYSISAAVNKKILPKKNIIAEVEILDNGKLETKIFKFNSFQKQFEFNRIRMIEFEKRISALKFSPTRLDYLEKTIDFLKQHGTVLVVRMPITKTPYAIESKYIPDFNDLMRNLSAEKKVKYINYNDFPNNYKCTDEVHLTSESINKFSEALAKDILTKF